MRAEPLVEKEQIDLLSIGILLKKLAIALPKVIEITF
jgi:hypothetical protein